jgi:p-hydroxybenzoate 3-monooxygenase
LDVWIGGRNDPANQRGAAREGMGSEIERTQVGIIGAGPAGLLLGRLLERAGIDAVVLERQSREYVEHRQRAGILEQPTVDLLEELGLAERLHAEGDLHDGIELRFDGESHRVDFPSLCGRRVALWPQTEVVKDAIAARVASGARLDFEVVDVAVHDHDTARPRITYADAEGAARELVCDVVAGCDGFHGITRQAVAGGDVTVATREYPFGWLGILARVPPSCEELIYASSDRGFALHSMRTPEISRLYLQCDPRDDLDEWPDERIWDELQRRLALDGWALEEGPIFDRSITPMRSFVAAPMRHGRLFLAGDAAHIVPPTGAKGLNLAVADVALLADALERFFGSGDDAALEAYSERALRRVWRAEHFSWWMTSMLHRFPDADGFERGLQRSQLDYVCSSDAARTTLAENYTGLPL